MGIFGLIDSVGRRKRGVEGKNLLKVNFDVV
jgi:hypothetical protein